MAPGKDAKPTAAAADNTMIVGKARGEREPNVGCGDRVEAEFIADLGRSVEMVDEFDAKLNEKGAEFLDGFIRADRKIIHVIGWPKFKSGSDKPDGKKGGGSAYSGLTIAGDRDGATATEEEIEGEVKEKEPMGWGA